MIARWRPLHRGQVAVLDALVERSDELQVGIGSSNQYDARNPFTAEETEAMLRLHLPAAVRVLPVPDLGHGPRWTAMVLDLLGPLDLFVTANPYVWSLLAPHYRMCHPVHLVPPERRVPVEGTMVRAAMAEGEGWRALVTPEVEAWLHERRLVERYRREFGGRDTPSLRGLPS